MRRPSRAGFSLVEVMVAVGVLTVTILALLATLLQSQRLRQVSAETELASSALHAKLGEVRSSSDSLGDIVLAEGAFSVADPRLKDAAGLVEILNEAEASSALRVDLNDDGAVDANDLYDLDGDDDAGEGDASDPSDTTTGSVKSSYDQLVPVRVSLTWTSVAGKPRTLTLVSFVYPRETQ